jgi:hypothetical protein
MSISQMTDIGEQGSSSFDFPEVLVFKESSTSSYLDSSSLDPCDGIRLLNEDSGNWLTVIHGHNLGDGSRESFQCLIGGTLDSLSPH